MALGDKIGIMTWYKYKNYGSILQAYALTYAIKKQGYFPALINYTPKKNRFQNSEYTYKSILKKIIRVILGLSAYKSETRDKMFENFIRDNLVETDECTSAVELEELNNRYAAFVCGSDQIWSPSCYDEKYFLSFVKDENKLIAYAPSIGLNQITDLDISREMQKQISRFKHLSIRETQGKNIIHEKWGYNAEVVLDPTLLITGDEWCELISMKKEEVLNFVKNNTYILCYFLGNPRKYRKHVQMLSKELHLPVYVIPTYKYQEKMKNKVPFEVGPEEFLYLIKNAEYVCTDSFHGMAFSINFNIPFLVFERFANRDINNQNSRIYSLLETLGLRDCIFKKKYFLDFLNAKMNFAKTNTILNRERKKSINFLQKSLKEAAGAGVQVQKEDLLVITEYCCGCGACASACPQGAIQIKKNKYHFWQHEVDEQKCCHCNICKTVCPFKSVDAKKISEGKGLYAIKSKDACVLKSSSSGGGAHEIAQYMIDREYNICGCMYNIEKRLAEHILISPEQREKLALLQGSKYIQSNSQDIIKQLSKATVDDKFVFIGTPCQVAGLEKIIRRTGDSKNFLLVDLICHGVPSYHLWDKYLKELQIKKKMRHAPQVVFRDKTYGWNPRTIKINETQHIYKRNEFKDDFYMFFKLGQCYMLSCYECPYREKTVADIRLGDYWGKRFAKDSTGVSMAIAMTERGNEILTGLYKEQRIYLDDYPLEEYWKVQFPSNQLKPIYYDKLMNDLENPKIKLKSIRKKYCTFLERRERLGRLRKKWG